MINVTFEERIFSFIYVIVVIFVVVLEYSFLFLFVTFIVFILDGYSNFNRNFAHYHISKIILDNEHSRFLIISNVSSRVTFILTFSLILYILEVK